MAAPVVPDDLWAAISPLLPPEPPKPKGNRPRVADRVALAGIVRPDRVVVPSPALDQHPIPHLSTGRLRAAACEDIGDV